MDDYDWDVKILLKKEYNLAPEEVDEMPESQIIRLIDKLKDKKRKGELDNELEKMRLGL